MTIMLCALLAGCGGGGGESGGATGPGTVSVSLTDAPSCGFDAVNVTVARVRVHQSSSAADTDAGWTDITLSPPRKINLLNLTNGVLDSLGETPLAAGRYTQLRLVLDPNTAQGLVNSVIPTGGVETPLITPSAVQSGIKLVHEFDVASGRRVDLVLDFDACKSIVIRGNGTYALKPVVKVIPFTLNGISGIIAPALLGNNVMVTAQQNGVIVQSTAPNTTGNGAFFLARLAPGNYDVVITANNRATAVITGVPVATDTSVVSISNNIIPIALPVSTTRTVSGTAVLNPASLTETALVTAKQTFGGTPTVTVKFKAADDTAGGAYSLALPVGAPMLGQFGTGVLPIVLVEQAAVAGKYTAAASAAGYQTQSVGANIDFADATRNFILVP